MTATQDPHTVRAFDSDLKALGRTLTRMAGLAEAQLADALKSLIRRDDALADETIANDDRMDACEEAVNKQAVKILALRQPMGDDLRAILSSIKIASALERIGDYAEAIARRGKQIRPDELTPAVRTVGRMGALVQEVLHDSLDAFLTRDGARARAVWERDQEIDDFYASLFRELLTYMMEDPRQIGGCIQMMFMAKNLERIGDHATNMSEATWYIVNGKSMKRSGAPL